jgi:hypothetical protein
MAYIILGFHHGWWLGFLGVIVIVVFLAIALSGGKD